MQRSQFTFYESFASALKRIKKKQDRADAYDAIVNYALYGTEPDMDSLPDSAAIAFDLIRPTLDASKRKAESGRSGGKRKQTGSKPEANSKGEQSGPEKEGEKEKEGEIENECYISPNPSFNPPTLQEVQDYAAVNRYLSDPKRFFDYYAAGGWRDRDGLPINWRQKFLIWENREQDRIRKQSATSGRKSWTDLAEQMDREGTV